MVSALETYRPLFMVVTFSFLGAAFYFTYRRRPAAAADDCCAPDARPRGLNMMAVNKIMLWAVTAMAVVFLFFPQYMTSLLGGGEVTAEMEQTLISIDGMTCRG